MLHCQHISLLWMQKLKAIFDDKPNATTAKWINLSQLLTLINLSHQFVSGAIFVVYLHPGSQGSCSGSAVLGADMEKLPKLGE